MERLQTESAFEYTEWPKKYSINTAVKCFKYSAMYLSNKLNLNRNT